MSAQTDSPTNPNYDLMIKQAMKSKSKKQFRVVGVMVIADREAFNSANSDGEETDKQVVFSQDHPRHYHFYEQQHYYMVGLPNNRDDGL
jgi:hypothetical protein